jgi:hypothetical protein
MRACSMNHWMKGNVIITRGRSINSQVAALNQAGFTWLWRGKPWRLPNCLQLPWSRKWGVAAKNQSQTKHVLWTSSTIIEWSPACKICSVATKSVHCDQQRFARGFHEHSFDNFHTGTQVIYVKFCWLWTPHVIRMSYHWGCFKIIGCTNCAWGRDYQKAGWDNLGVWCPIFFGLKLQIQTWRLCWEFSWFLSLL